MSNISGKRFFPDFRFPSKCALLHSLGIGVSLLQVKELVVIHLFTYPHLIISVTVISCIGLSHCHGVGLCEISSCCYLFTFSIAVSRFTTLMSVHFSRDICSGGRPISFLFHEMSVPSRYVMTYLLGGKNPGSHLYVYSMLQYQWLDFGDRVFE